MHFTWSQLIPGVGHHYSHVATLAIVSLVLILIGIRARVALGSGPSSVIPTSSFSVRGVFELLTEGIGKLADQVIGHHGRPFAPYFTAVFLFILFNNFVGLIPGMVPATENFNTTFALGIFSFIAYNVIGIKHGGLGYLKHFLGPVWWLAPLMLAIE